MMSQRHAKEPDGDWKAEAVDGGGDGGGRRVAAAPVPLLPPPLPLPGSPLGARRIGHGRQLKMAPWRRMMVVVERRGGRRLMVAGGTVVAAAAMAPRAARSGWLHGAPGQISFAGPGRPSLGQVVLRWARSNCEGWLFFSINTYKNKQLLSFARADRPQGGFRGVGFSRTYGGCATRSQNHSCMRHSRENERYTGRGWNRGGFLDVRGTGVDF